MLWLNVLRSNVTTVPLPADCSDLFRRRTWTAVWFLPHVCMLLIFLWSRISEVSDYVSIKHIHCPAINALIAGEKENVLGSFNNGVVFIRGHSGVKVGKPCNPSTPQTHTDHNMTCWNTWTVSASVKFYLANNTNRGSKQLKEVCQWTKSLKYRVRAF